MSGDCRVAVVDGRVGNAILGGIMQTDERETVPEKDGGLAERLKLQRTKLAWTQEHLAEQAGVSVRTVQRIERGEAPSAETLRVLAAALGTTVNALQPEALRQDFGAPASRAVKVMTVAALTILIGGAVVAAFYSPLLQTLLLVVLALTVVYAVSGYSVRDEVIVVHRLGWATKLPLDQLTEVSVNPHAMMGSLRLWGNGGVFGFIGQFRNEVLGRYRALVTDPAHGVVLRFGEGRPVVVSPDDPAAFRQAVTAALARRARPES